MLEWSEVATCKTNRPCGFMSRTVLDYESDTAVISGPLGFPAANFCMTARTGARAKSKCEPDKYCDCQIPANENLRGSSSIAVCGTHEL
ncbi:hypothetical protein EAF00_011730 [Botryotinia globosa]|nr:hypothetical protein EAF00_011730 [Botryotinia globosa]